MTTLNRKAIENLLTNSPLTLAGSTGKYQLVNHYAQTPVYTARTLPEIRRQITVLLGR
ncbi:MAG: hypothetical protein KME13_23385 [Myxacorys californica WJT36-NPBG1]|jgi:hypothetical protein|nr:hypothetical protein [Myxacorys californica WJT36-NPBG1]